ncbi:hypothetical protein [Sphingomonas sp. ERG5]|uniref:hypothetical protein n=1 Tax=Sphingomonas sp. ERG5 TaxID=1381597 RepID=UPI00054C5F1A|nr:hypothetical protein [Sphingomonas sp. ERG5]
MSRLYGIWRTLGIEKTREVSAIRAAYARALKAFEIDEDPARYAALRDARDAALAHARQPQSDVPDDEESDNLEDEPEDLIAPGIVIPLPDFTTGFDAPTLVDAPAPAAPISITPIAPAVDFRPAPSEPVPPAGVRTLPLVEVTLTPPVLDRTEAPPLRLVNGLPAGFAEAMDQRYNAVLGLLFPQDERRHYLLDGRDMRLLREHVTVLLADPRLDEIAFREDADRWFANVVAQSIPRSDPILDRVMEAFGWLASRGRIDQSPAVAAIVARHDSLAFADEVREKGHALNSAWRELTKPAGENSRRGTGVNGTKVRQLLAKIRRDHPDLESRLDGYRVSLWEQPQPSAFFGDWRTIAVGIWLLIMVISAVGKSGVNLGPGDTRPPAPVFDLRSPDQAYMDIDDLLQDLGGHWIDYDMVKRRNPALYEQLTAAWKSAKDKGGRPAFFTNARAMLIERYSNGLLQADYDALVLYRRLFLERLKQARAAGSAACEQYLTEGTSPSLQNNLVLSEREQEVIARILLETNAAPSGAKDEIRHYRVDGAVVTAAAKRAGLSRDRFSEAMLGKGTAKTHCSATIGLLETALKLPKEQGLPLLRNM